MTFNKRPLWKILVHGLVQVFVRLFTLDGYVFMLNKIPIKVGEVVGAAGTEGSSRAANKKMYNGQVTENNISYTIIL